MKKVINLLILVLGINLFSAEMSQKERVELLGREFREILGNAYLSSCKEKGEEGAHYVTKEDGFPKELSNLILEKVSPFEYEELHILKGHAGSGIESLAWSHNGKYLASITDNEAIIWDVASGSPLKVLKKLQGGRGIVWSPDDSFLAIGMEEGTMFWKLERGQEKKVLKNIYGYSWSPDGNLYAYYDESDSDFKIFNASTNQEILSFYRCDLGHYQWSNDSQKIIMYDNSIDTIDVFGISGSREESKSFSSHSYIGWINPNKILYISKDGVKRINIFDLSNDKWHYEFVFETPLQHGTISSRGEVAFSSSFYQSRYSSGKPKILIYDIARKKLLQEIGLKGLAYSLAWSPDGSMLASGLQDGTIIIWAKTFA